MKYKTMANLLRGVIILLVLCGLFVNFWLLPNMWNDPYLATNEWIILTGAAILPCYAAMIMAWIIVDSIAKEQEFSYRNSFLFRWISVLAIADSGVFITGTLVLFIMKRAFSWNMIASVPLAVAGVCIAICAAVLSRLVGKAADLKTDADLTI